VKEVGRGDSFLLFVAIAKKEKKENHNFVT
jgi:hypothetical protein